MTAAGQRDPFATRSAVLFCYWCVIQQMPQNYDVSAFILTCIIKRAETGAAAHRHTVDTAMVVQNTSTCLTGRKVADKRSVTITDVHQRFVGSSRVYVRAREAVYVLVLAYAAAQ